MQQNWHINAKHNDCKDYWNSIVFAVLELGVNTFNREKSYDSWQEDLYEDKEVQPEKDPPEEIIAWQYDSDPSAARFFVVPNTDSGTCVKNDAEEQYCYHEANNRELQRNKVGSVVSHLIKSSAKGLFLREF